MKKMGLVSELLYGPSVSCERRITTHDDCSDEGPVRWEHTLGTHDPGLGLREGFLEEARGSELEGDSAPVPSRKISLQKERKSI